MSPSLYERFAYGSVLSGLPSLEGPEAFVNEPWTQRETVSLHREANRSIDAVRKTLASVPVVVAASVREMQLGVQDTLHGIQRAVVDGVEAATQREIRAIEQLEEHLSAELVEIRWVLTQNLGVLEEILEVLRRRRRTEAQELVRQAVRSYAFGDFEEAESRFREAYRQDNTDYQVLLNLGMLEIRKGRGDEGRFFLTRSLGLPENLDLASRARSLRALACLSYAEGDYVKAADHQNRALTLVAQPAHLFRLGVYLMLSRSEERGVRVILEAISQDHRILAAALVAPDLAPMRERLLPVLGAIASKAHDDLLEVVKRLDEDVARVEALPGWPVPGELPVRIARAVSVLKAAAASPSYPECAGLMQKGRSVTAAVDLASRIVALAPQQTALEQELRRKEEALPRVKSAVPIGVLSYLGGGLAAGAAWLVLGPAAPPLPAGLPAGPWDGVLTRVAGPLVLVLLWPLGLIAGSCHCVSGREGGVAELLCGLVGIAGRFVSRRLLQRAEAATRRREAASQRSVDAVRERLQDLQREAGALHRGADAALERYPAE